MLVIKLDRILNRDDVVIVIHIQIVDQARQCRAFARSGRTRHEHQTTRAQHHLDDRLGEPKLLGTELIVGNLTQHHRDKPALLENRHPETSQCTEGKPKVRRTDLLQLPLASFRCNRFHQLHRVVGLKHLGLKFAHPTMKPKHWRLPNDNVDVAGPLLDGRLEKLID